MKKQIFLLIFCLLLDTLRASGSSLDDGGATARSSLTSVYWHYDSGRDQIRPYAKTAPIFKDGKTTGCICLRGVCSEDYENLFPLGFLPSGMKQADFDEAITFQRCPYRALVSIYETWGSYSVDEGQPIGMSSFMGAAELTNVPGGEGLHWVLRLKDKYAAFADVISKTVVVADLFGEVRLMGEGHMVPRNGTADLCARFCSDEGAPSYADRSWRSLLAKRIAALGL